MKARWYIKIQAITLQYLKYLQHILKDSKKCKKHNRLMLF